MYVVFRLVNCMYTRITMYDIKSIIIGEIKITESFFFFFFFYTKSNRSIFFGIGFRQFSFWEGRAEFFMKKFFKMKNLVKKLF